MYSALVVDDEEIIRRGICRKLERFFQDIHVLPPQENAIEALHYIQSHSVDVVYVDIKMPMLDGLEFIRRARRYDSHLQFVVISGYTNFEYAKEALHLKVRDYLLKPIDNAEFRDVTERIIEELNRKDYNIKSENKTRAQAEEGRFLKKNRYLTELIRMDSLIDTVELLKELEGLKVNFSNTHFQIVTVLVQNIREIHDFKDIPGQFILKFAVCNIINEIFMNLNCQVFAHEKNENQFVAILNTQTSVAAHFVREKAKYLTDVLYNIYQIKAFAGIGLEVHRTEDICVSYSQAMESALCGIMMADKQVELFQDETDKKAEFQFINELEKNVLEKYIKSQNEQGIADFIKEIVGRLRIVGINYANLRIICFDIYVLVVKLLQEKGKDADAALNMLEWMEEKLRKGIGLNETEKFLTESLTEISTQFDEYKRTGAKALIESIIEYVNTHYSKDISLSGIAGKFYINPCYLSQLFKKEMNMKFIDYITKIRLQKSVELLQTTSLTVNEIAEAVGYKDARYFREIFVKHMGETPSHLRKKDGK